MGYNNSANIYVTNDTGGNANITLSHEYSDDGPQTQTWNNVAPGSNAGPLAVGFNTGFLYTGQDYWFCGVQVLDGPNAGNYATEGSADSPEKQCTLESEDNGASLTFAVSTSVFVMTELSGSCSTGVSLVSDALAQSAKRPKLAKAAKAGRQTK